MRSKDFCQISNIYKEEKLRNFISALWTVHTFLRKEAEVLQR